MSIRILAIESSCDDTSAAIMVDGQLISLGVSNQEVHAKYGGVVPELASRAHLQNIVPVIVDVINQAGLEPKDLSAIAFTQGPGLLGSLLVGTNFAKSFALASNIPLISVNHMEAHIMAHMIDDPKPTFPFLCLTVSGGHTQIVLVKSPLQFQILGETIDDAAGEAFDKTGKMLGLPYPAGPEIDKLARKGMPLYSFTHPKVKGYNYSFSGLKTSIRNFIIKEKNKDIDFIGSHLNDICSSVQKTIVDILLHNLEKAALDHDISEIAIAGGVSANSGLRIGLTDLCSSHNWTAYIPKFEYCTDNAAMIAMSAHFKYLKGDFEQQTIAPEPRLKMLH